jgi:glutathione synthase/RimK-type ligase-like ATP-grasp enzyme
MRVLITEGSSLSARQIVAALGARGCEVHLLDAGRTPLARFSRFVRGVHRVAPVGEDPFAWLDTALEVVGVIRPDVLLASHEQTAVLARAHDRVAATGVGFAVPEFASLAQVQDKAAASALLTRLGLPQPATAIADSPAALRQLCEPPVYVKARIATASTGVVLVRDSADVEAAVARFADVEAAVARFADVEAAVARFGADEGGVLVQEAVAGPLAMVQAIFDRGRLVAHHAAMRIREGASGGSSAKRGVTLPLIAAHLTTLGAHTAWHGALSLDAILTPDGPRYIDLNPRLVEPGNAQRAGVDLVGALLDVSLGRSPAAAAPPRPGVRTHQLLVALLGAAEAGRGRRGVAGELLRAALGRDVYAGSHEELLALRSDPPAAIPLIAVGASLLARPASVEQFTRATIGRYALTPAAWASICAGTAISSDAPISSGAAPG